MYIEIERHENYCNVRSNGDGRLIFLSKENQPLNDYPAELATLDCPLRSPLVVHLELTRRCGLQCKHCYTSQPENQGSQNYPQWNGKTFWISSESWKS